MKQTFQPLPRYFYSCPATLVAPDLLGCYLVRKLGNRLIAGKIIETEAYMGLSDAASHARFGKTKRNTALYKPPGHAYIYRIYGIYFCFNATVGPLEKYESVFIRALDIPDCQGPAKLCRKLSIDLSLNGLDLTLGKNLWLSNKSTVISPASIQSLPRIGIDFAGKDKLNLWRYRLNS